MKTTFSPPTDEAWLDAVHWGDNGLIAVVTQEASSLRVLTVAWMNRAALQATAASGYVTYWSRSRKQLWRKGEQSGHCQRLVELRLDCDGDALVCLVEQQGGVACHTGRHSCFYQRLQADGWHSVDPVLKDPKDIYA